MRIGTRLVLILTFLVTVIMSAYAMISLRQREALISDALIRDAENQARTLQIVLNNALRDERFTDIRRVLARVGDDPETFASAMLDRGGHVHTGGPADAVTCLIEQRPEILAPGREVRGWADCGGRVRWVVLPLADPGSAVVLARWATVVDEDMAGTRWRVFLTTLVLAMAAGLSILLVLRRTLSTPLAGILRGVRSLGGPETSVRVEVPRTAGELHELATAFNEMADRLEGKRRSLIRETEERLELERQLRHAEKFAALGRFTGGLAHELGTPLNVIEVRAEAIAGDADAPVRSRDHAEKIVREIDRIADLVRGLSHVARRHEIAREPVDLVDVARRVVQDLEPRANGAAARLSLDSGSESAPVEGDGTLLRHALNNLVVNAIQSVGRGAGGEVSVAVTRSDGAVRVTIEDDGPGIAPEHRAHLFEPFFTTRDVGEGTGLGLAISLGIAEEHGGSLRIEPRPEGGVRAVLTLPAVEGSS